MSTLKSSIEKISTRHPEARVDLIARAYDSLGERTGSDPRRASEVVGILADLNLDDTTALAAILCEKLAPNGELEVDDASLYGEEVAYIVESFSKLERLRYASGTKDQAERFRRLILSLAHDVRAVMLLLARQLHDMQHLESASREDQISAAVETLEVYAPLANRLGIHKLKSELEDLGLCFSEPDVYSDLEARLGESSKESESYIKEVMEVLAELIEELEVKGDVSGRTKHLFSIYRKMLDQDIPFEKVYDRIAFRILVDELRDCYAVLGGVHARWTPVPGRFKDYIALPKSNLYQSLHTTVIGPRGKPMEVQIRTHDMHRIAEEGIAAHWRYKEKGSSITHDDKVFDWLRRIVETTTEESEDEGDLADRMATDLFPDVVYVFTPAGEVMELPRGSTPVDFAFNVHSQVGMRCVGGKVNDRMVSLDYQLKNGDRVEIITSKTQTPSPDWLEFVKSGKAKSRIRQVIRSEQRGRSQALGKDVCDREFRKVGKSFSKALKEGLVATVADKFGVNKAEEIMEAVGFGKMSGRQVLEKVYPEFEQKESEEPKRARKVKKSTKGIVISGVGDAMTRFAKCCNPLPMEPVVGFITRGHGMTVHTAKCANISRADPARRIDVEWGTGEQGDHSVRIKVSCTNEMGMLSSITNLLTQNDVNVTWAEVKTYVMGRADCSFEIMVPDVGKLKKLFKEIQSLKGVHNVVRVKN